MKTYYIQYNIGTVKYLVSFHDGVKTHPDCSNFFDVAIFKSKKALKEFTDKLEADGYIDMYRSFLKRKNP